MQLRIPVACLFAIAFLSAGWPVEASHSPVHSAGSAVFGITPSPSRHIAWRCDSATCYDYVILDASRGNFVVHASSCYDSATPTTCGPLTGVAYAKFANANGVDIFAWEFYEGVWIASWRAEGDGMVHGWHFSIDVWVGPSTFDGGFVTSIGGTPRGTPHVTISQA